MKGKYAARAALRREDTEVRSDIASYQHHVKRLTDENAKLKADLITCRRDSAAESRKLRGMLSEGLSPELIALREELERQRDRAHSAITKCKDVREHYDKLMDFVAAVLHHVTGCTGLEAVEAMSNAFGDPFMLAYATDAERTNSGDAGQVATLQRVRGWRSKPSVIQYLNEICEAANAVQRPLRKRARQVER